jgi:hypothetical protein
MSIISKEKPDFLHLAEEQPVVAAILLRYNLEIERVRA